VVLVSPQFSVRPLFLMRDLVVYICAFITIVGISSNGEITIWESTRWLLPLLRCG